MNAVSPCVLPRRRFVLWFLGGCVLWVVACGVYRGMLSGNPGRGGMVVSLAGEGALDAVHHDSVRRGNDGRIIPLPSGVLVDMPDES